MHRFYLVVLVLGACGRQVPAVEPSARSPARPAWTLNLSVHVDAMSACLKGREEPHSVVFVAPLASGAVGVNTIDAYGSVDFCTYLEGRIVQREDAPFSAMDSRRFGRCFVRVGRGQARSSPKHAGR